MATKSSRYRRKLFFFSQFLFFANLDEGDEIKKVDRKKVWGKKEKKMIS
jgi:hypothetical protein